MGAPKIPPPPPPPAPPPAPTKMAEMVKPAVTRQGVSSKKRGVSALSVRRPSVNVGSSGTGANV